MAENKQAAQSATLTANHNNALEEELKRLRDEVKKAEAEAEAAKAEKAALETKLKAQSDAVESEVSRQEELIKRQLEAQRKVRIVIASGKDPQDRCPVPVAVNGREYLIVRDKPVDVPQGVLNVLDLAVEMVAEVVDEGGQNRTVFKPAQRFSYRVLGTVDPKTGDLAGA